MSDCTGTRHIPTLHSYRRHGCRCPDTIAAARAAWSRRRPRPNTHDRDPHVDIIAVDRAIQGDPVRLTIRERGEAIRRLTRAGLSAAQIATRVGVTQRTVVRYRTGRIAHARQEAA